MSLHYVMKRRLANGNVKWKNLKLLLTDCDREFCLKRGAGVYALGSCSDSYCNCDHGGKAYKFPCGPGTLFDSLILGCNYAHNIKGCESIAKSSTS